jgi:hypothetical protein
MTGQCNWCSIRAARVASSSATSCGVDDDRAVERDLLGERELRLAGARRQVDDQKVLRAPQRVLEELAHRTHHHRAAPDNRRLFSQEKAH